MRGRPELFLAAPLSTVEQREFNEAAAAAVGDVFSVFLPQRDVGLLKDLERSGLSSVAARRRVFEEDLKGLRRADVVLAVLESPLVSGGVALELGIAFALGKLCVGLQSPRRKAAGGESSPMLEGTLAEVFESLDQLGAWSRSYGGGRLSAAR